MSIGRTAKIRWEKLQKTLQNVENGSNDKDYVYADNHNFSHNFDLACKR